MKNVKRFAQVLICGAIGGCGPLPDEGATSGQPIVGGVRAAEGEFPFAVRLNITVPGGTALCGGSLVSPTMVLTAGHCVLGRAPSTITATIGRTRLSSTATGEVRTVSEVLVHPLYNRSTHDYDVALLRLSAASTRPIVRVASPYGPSDRALWTPSTVATTVGWGRTTEGGPLSDDLMKVDIPILDDVAPSQASSYGSSFHPTVMLAAGPMEGGRDSCQGDSGGPLLVQSSRGPRQVGVVSWGEGCARVNKPGLYTRISAQRIHRWVSSVIHETPLVGDVNGDGRADIVRATHGTNPEIFVALSTGAAFGGATRWHDHFGHRGVMVALGDFDGDRRDDLWGVNDDSVWVTRSTGTSFLSGSYSRVGIASPSEIARVGDVNNDGRADLVLFTANASADVFVMLSTGTSLGAKTLWHGAFAQEGHTPYLADVNGDGRKDIVSFNQGISGTSVRVALSNGTSFGAVTTWNSLLGATGEVPGVGYFNRDGRQDVAVFSRSASRTVYVGLSNGATRFDATPWSSAFGSATSTPRTGDVNGDGLTDVVDFTQDADADVNVGLSNGASFNPFTRWHGSFAP